MARWSLHDGNGVVQITVLRIIRWRWRQERLHNAFGLYCRNDLKSQLIVLHSQGGWQVNCLDCSNVTQQIAAVRPDMNVINANICTDDDIAALLETIENFADAEIATRWQRPEIAIAPDALKAIQEAAHQHGLLDASSDGYGLWAELTRNAAPRLTLAALSCLARCNASAALHLHQLALAQAARTTSATISTVTELVLTGAQGWGRSALVRWLHEQATHDDVQVLADNYAATPAHPAQKRLLWVAPATDVALVPVFDNQQFYLALVSLDTPANGRHPSLHGLDGLCGKTCGAEHWRIPLDRHTHVALITAHLLGLAAIALGLARSAEQRAIEYAQLRVQGARHIIKHDAVAALVSDMEGAMLATRLQLEGACQPMEFPALATALATKHECLPPAVPGGQCSHANSRWCGIHARYRYRKPVAGCQLPTRTGRLPSRAWLDAGYRTRSLSGTT
ncbi:hypothetical protein HDN1F_08120 [gamma proteobacterium HdN1]|nr:hypothetical protein HDN1F_08120 [gamma proteobacterium HdN1]